MSVSRDSRYAGTLVASACGDALGATLEFQSRGAVARQYPQGLRDLIGGGWMALEPGETTDDTALTLALARACTSDGIDLDQVAANFVAWMQTGPKDIGYQTRQALALLASGLRWYEAGERLQRKSPRGVAGNGSVMRCAPIALRFRSHPERMVQAAIDTSRITHADPRATWGCVAICQAIAHLLNGGAIDSVLDAAMTGVQDDRVQSAVAAAGTLDYEHMRSGGFVLETITAALWSLLHADTAEDIIVRAAMMGEDADTTATVAGALAGAAYGVEAVPQRWRTVLHGRTEIEALARQLLRMDVGSCRE